MAKHLKGNLPKFVKMGYHKLISGPNLYCELSGPKPRPLLPASLRSKVMEAFHSIDHCGQKALLQRTASEYYWPRQSSDVRDFKRLCHWCQSAHTGKPIHMPISQIPVPKTRFSHINLDILGPLPVSNGYKYLLTIVCRTTRFVQAVPLVSADAKSCTRAFLHHWLAFFSLPAVATSDNGNTFISQVWKGLQDTLGIKVIFTPRYRPQANSAIERQHQSIKNSLKAALLEMGDKHREKWSDILPWVLMGLSLIHI